MMFWKENATLWGIILSGNQLAKYGDNLSCMVDLYWFCQLSSVDRGLPMAVWLLKSPEAFNTSYTVPKCKWGIKKRINLQHFCFFYLIEFFFLVVLEALGIPSYLSRHAEVHAHTYIKKLLAQLPWSVGDGVWNWFSGWFCYCCC